jgi:hypothetical protein
VQLSATPDEGKKKGSKELCVGEAAGTSVATCPISCFFSLAIRSFYPVQSESKSIVGVGNSFCLFYRLPLVGCFSYCMGVSEYGCLRAFNEDLVCHFFPLFS